MDPLTIAAAGGLRSRMESLDMLANNLANVSTAGFKIDREFYSLYASPDAMAKDGATPQVLPTIDRSWTDLSQGSLQQTGKQLDLALDGGGFFAVSGPSGPLYTRSGEFRVSPAGIAVTPEGYPLQLTDGRPLRLNGNQTIEVARDGSVSQAGQVLGRLAVVSFADPARIEKHGANYFKTADPNNITRAAAEVRQGALENSNVNAAESAGRLVALMRQFEMLQKAISIGGEMNRKATEEVAKT